MGRYLSITPVDQLRWQLSMRFYSTWYRSRSQYISQEKWVHCEFACFVRLSIVFFKCYFKLFLCLLTSKSQKIFLGLHPLSPHQGPAIDPLGVPAALSTTCISCSYNLGTFGATNVDFFFCINPLVIQI